MLIGGDCLFGTVRAISLYYHHSHLALTHRKGEMEAVPQMGRFKGDGGFFYLNDNDYRCH
ncbi:hypothetical protein QKW52_01290 [Bacillus sonorensis]|nr:hypothetical protein [Bacillus sonorensis]TWK72730.1 hypothetical protein CHCC20335_1395 [Bacillus paralicheniformis]